MVKNQCRCLTWALVPNHHQVLVHAEPLPLSKLMAPVLDGYGGYRNHRRRRTGYVSRNRFRSILSDDDSYLLDLVTISISASIKTCSNGTGSYRTQAVTVDDVG